MPLSSSPSVQQRKHFVRRPQGWQQPSSDIIFQITGSCAVIQLFHVNFRSPRVRHFSNFSRKCRSLTSSQCGCVRHFSNFRRKCRSLTSSQCGCVRHFSNFCRKCRSLTSPQCRLRPAFFQFSPQMPVVHFASVPAASGIFPVFALCDGRSHLLSAGCVRHFSFFHHK